MVENRQSVRETITQPDLQHIRQLEQLKKSYNSDDNLLLLIDVLYHSSTKIVTRSTIA